MAEFKFNSREFERKLKQAAGRKIAEAQLDLPCPECGHKNRVAGRHIAAQRTITCSGCGKSITLIDEGGGFGKFISGR